MEAAQKVTLELLKRVIPERYQDDAVFGALVESTLVVEQIGNFVVATFVQQDFSENSVSFLHGVTKCNPQCDTFNFDRGARIATIRAYLRWKDQDYQVPGRGPWVDLPYDLQDPEPLPEVFSEPSKGAPDVTVWPGVKRAIGSCGTERFPPEPPQESRPRVSEEGYRYVYGGETYITKNERIIACAGSKVTAVKPSVVEARGGSQVDAEAGSTVYAYPNSEVWAYKGSYVSAQSGAIVYEQGGKVRWEAQRAGDDRGAALRRADTDGPTEPKYPGVNLLLSDRSASSIMNAVPTALYQSGYPGGAKAFLEEAVALEDYAGLLRITRKYVTLI